MTTWKTFDKALIKKFQPDLWAFLQDSEDEKQDYKAIESEKGMEQERGELRILESQEGATVESTA